MKTSSWRPFWERLQSASKQRCEFCPQKVPSTLCQARSTSQLAPWHSGNRPHLPFLHSGLSSRSRQGEKNRQSLRHLLNLSRRMTTEQKRFLKNHLRLSFRISLAGWSLVLLWALLALLAQAGVLMSEYPSPRDWTFLTRTMYLWARRFEFYVESEQDPNWSEMLGTYHRILARLEHPWKDGVGLQKDLESEINFKSGKFDVFDISIKPEPWRRAYFELLMDMGRVSEIVYAAQLEAEDFGSAEPHTNSSTPRFLSQAQLKSTKNPQELVHESLPQTPIAIYDKILATKGLDNSQYIRALLAVADWYEFHGNKDKAQQEILRALRLVPKHELESIVDSNTGVIRATNSHISNNTLTASTALASFKARQRDFGSAMSIYLSVLRARDALPREPSRRLSESVATKSAQLQNIWHNLIHEPPFPEAPPSGEMPLRRVSGELCEEAGVMANIGEVLYASANPDSTSISKVSDDMSTRLLPLQQQQSEGLAWTIRAVDLAQSTFETLPTQDSSGRKKCTQCMNHAMRNWSLMAQTIAQRQDLLQQEDKKTSSSRWHFWARPQRSAILDTNEMLQDAAERSEEVNSLLAREADRLEQQHTFMGTLQIQR